MPLQELKSAQRRYLKQQAHHLKPLVQMGKDGPSDAFSRQLDEQLGAHELVKVRILNNCLSGSEEIKAMFAAIGALVIQKVGNVYTVFRQKPEDSWFNLPG